MEQAAATVGRQPERDIKMNSLYDEFVDIFGAYTPIVATDANGVSFDCWNWSYIGMIACVVVLLWLCCSIMRSIISSIFRS